MEKIITSDAFAIAPVHGGAGHGHFIGPFSQRHGATAVLMVNVAATVCALVLWHAPHTVFRAVWTIVVNALNRVPGRWTLAHVRQKVFKSQPPLTHGNATRSIVLEVFGSRIRAAIDHAGPDSMLARARRTMRAQALGVALSKLLAAKAAAGQAATMQQVGRSHQLGLPARTHTDPSRATAQCVLASMRNGKAAKNVTSQIMCFCHTSIVLVRQHCGGHLFWSAA